MFDMGSILLALGLLILVGLFVSRPLLERKSVAVSEDEQTLSALLAERDRYLDALQELDFDHQLGKIPAEEYPVQRGDLLHRGAEVLKKIDAFRRTAPAVSSVEDRLEAAIEARRADAATQLSGSGGSGRRSRVAGHPDDEIEAMIAARRRGRAEKAAGFCANCGQPLQKSDKFCARCGAQAL
jgi:hypothetical protein